MTTDSYLVVGGKSEFYMRNSESVLVPETIK